MVDKGEGDGVGDDDNNEDDDYNVDDDSTRIEMQRGILKFDINYTTYYIYKYIYINI